MIKKIYKKTLGIMLAAAMMLSAAGCTGDQKNGSGEVQAATEATTATVYAETENAEFEQYIKDAFTEDMLSSTEGYHTSIKDLSAFGIERPANAYWTTDDLSLSPEESFEQGRKKTQERYDRLMKFDGASLTEEEYFTFLTEKSSLELSLKSYEYAKYSEQFYPVRGLQSNIGTNLAEYLFREKQDIDDYITLMEKFPELVDYSCKIENWRAEQGYAMQDGMADVVIGQCDTFLADKDNHYLIQEFDRKVDEADFLTAEEKASYKEKDKEAIQYVFEGIETIKKTVSANKGKASVKGGLANYPDGKEYYNEYIIPYFAGSDKTGDELIAEFDNRIAQINTEMAMIIQTKPETYQFYAEHVADGTFFGDFDENEVPDALKKIEEKTLSNYPELPEIQFHASYLSPVLSDIMTNTLAYYMHPAFDDLENNVIRANANHPENKWLTLAHEGCPGHMFQFNYFMSTDPNPLRKSAYSLGYLEGWAVYSSYNTYYDFDFPGTDEDETIAKICYLSAEFGYLSQERMDLGINYEGWDVEKVAEYMTSQGWDASFAQQNYDTFLAQDPGLLLSYSQGYNEMNGMREYAEKKLGSRFDPVEFHKVILTAGPCMYKDLKVKVDEYIEENR